jgi:hypothetical protein
MNRTKKEVGLWIDHRKAVVVTFQDRIEKMQEISSDIESHMQSSNIQDSGDQNSSHQSGGEDVRDRHFGDHLENYYDRVISFIKNADSIWIFGPGEAKVELENRLKVKNLGARIVGIATVDKMTYPQISAKARDYFFGK